MSACCLVSWALDLAATTGGRDLLDGPPALGRWLADRGVEDPALALRLSDFHELRSSVRALLEAEVAGRSLPEDAVGAVNAASAAAPIHAGLVVGGGTVVLAQLTTAPPAAAVLAAIARSAIQLLGGPDRDRLRACPSCGRFFLAARPHQVWCTSACGNRVRVARHHERRRAAGRFGRPPTLPT